MVPVRAQQETEEIRRRLRAWQEKTLAAVQSMQLDSAAVLPLLLVDDPDQAPEPRNTPFSEKLQQECRMDGELEHDVVFLNKRRVFLATEPAAEDHHLRRTGCRRRPRRGPRANIWCPRRAPSYVASSTTGCCAL